LSSEVGEGSGAERRMKNGQYIGTRRSRQWLAQQSSVSEDLTSTFLEKGVISRVRLVLSKREPTLPHFFVGT
jgi:hypothetical protein